MLIWSRKTFLKSQPNIRCADKILTQLEMHAKAELYFGETENANGQFDLNGGRRRPILQRTSVRTEIISSFFLANLTSFHLGLSRLQREQHQ